MIVLSSELLHLCLVSIIAGKSTSPVKTLLFTNERKQKRNILKLARKRSELRGGITSPGKRKIIFAVLLPPGSYHVITVDSHVHRRSERWNKVGVGGRRFLSSRFIVALIDYSDRFEEIVDRSYRHRRCDRSFTEICRLPYFLYVTKNLCVARSAHWQWEKKYFDTKRFYLTQKKLFTR